jgi:hypothetical protein
MAAEAAPDTESSDNKATINLFIVLSIRFDMPMKIAATVKV